MTSHTQVLAEACLAPKTEPDSAWPSFSESLPVDCWTRAELRSKLCYFCPTRLLQSSGERNLRNGESALPRYAASSGLKS